MAKETVWRWECQDDECGTGETMVGKGVVKKTDEGARDHHEKTEHEVILWALVGRYPEEGK